MLLKVVLFAYSRGIVSSRNIECACREQVTFIALSGDSTPHFTTFADFVSTLGTEIGPLFKEVLLVCDRQELIGREMFAICPEIIYERKFCFIFRASTLTVTQKSL